MLRYGQPVLLPRRGTSTRYELAANGEGSEGGMQCL